VEHSSSAIEEIRRMLWDPKVRRRISSNESFAPILCQVSPVHGLPTDFLEINNSGGEGGRGITPSFPGSWQFER
jgi:hypothetical protein